MSWETENNGLGIFREQIIKSFVMKEEGMFTVADSILETRATALLADFEASGHRLAVFPSLWAALDEFGRWYTEPKFSVPTATFQMSIQRKIGNDTIALGMTITTNAETRQDRENAYFLLEKEIEARFSTLYVHKGRPTENEAPRGAVQGTEVDTFATTRLSHDFVEGKHRVRLHGGRWEKYGVPVYPETLKAMGHTEQSLPLGIHPEIGVATAMMKDGKPVKILGYSPAATQA